MDFIDSCRKRADACLKTVDSVYSEARGFLWWGHDKIGRKNSELTSFPIRLCRHLPVTKPGSCISSSRRPIVSHTSLSRACSGPPCMVSRRGWSFGWTVTRDCDVAMHYNQRPHTYIAWYSPPMSALATAARRADGRSTGGDGEGAARREGRICKTRAPLRPMPGRRFAEGRCDVTLVEMASADGRASDDLQRLTVDRDSLWHRRDKEWQWISLCMAHTSIPL